jgi:uncharacterized damage-inducible protein DinB
MPRVTVFISAFYPVHMNEVKFLVDQLKTTFKGDSWHGPNLVKSLKDISKEQAANKVIGTRHTIWELTDHMTYWLEEVRKSVQTKKNLNQSGDPWPRMGATEEDWKQSVNRLEAAVNMLSDELINWTNDDLAAIVPESDYTFKQMLHGVVHHNLYHVGQINILKSKE